MMNVPYKKITVVGAGLAGSECAWQLAQMGHQVDLIEARPVKFNEAHRTEDFAELVCSNSLGSLAESSAPGQLKWEAQRLKSLILNAALKHRVPAGQALGVDRELFAKEISEKLSSDPRIKIVRAEVRSLEEIPRPAVIATGPLTSSSLAESLKEHLGSHFLYFFDAIAPVIDADSIDREIAWRADRYDKGTADYLNCPLDKEQYYAFVSEIEKAKKITPKEFESTPFFEGCMPIEASIARGVETLRFGCMKPVGLRNPKTGHRPYAVVQLRQENQEGTAFNLVGFQTRMTYGEQTRIFRMIPGLQNAEFLKLGSIHRNLYVNTPSVLNKDLSSKKDEWLFLAGQITGVEGYFESASIGLLVAHFLHEKIHGQPMKFPPRDSAFGSLLNAITDPHRSENFQPTNINLGLFPPLEESVLDEHFPQGRNGFRKVDKEIKKQLIFARARSSSVTSIG